jgi:predicted DNA-binding transcriptional regulator AlpA
MSLDYLEFRIIAKRELAQLVPYSQSQIRRLEESGSFPVRVRLGPGRVGWPLREVLRWLQAREAERFEQQEADDAE